MFNMIISICKKWIFNFDLFDSENRALFYRSNCAFSQMIFEDWCLNYKLGRVYYKTKYAGWSIGKKEFFK